MSFIDQIKLGNTDLKVGRLGISSSYGAPAAAFEEAFEKGCNYFNWGTFIKGRSKEMKKAIRNLVKKGKRDELVIVFLSYAHNSWLMEKFFNRGLKQLGIDHADVLILGYYSKRPPENIIDRANKLKEKGSLRYVGITSHQRSVYPQLAKDNLLDIYHIRYNAVNRGAEFDTFPHINEGPGIVTFTATAWKKLLNPKKMPPGIKRPSAGDCYRYVLSHPKVHACMVGARNMREMREAFRVLEAGPMSEEELDRMRMIGDHIYGKHRP